MRSNRFDSTVLSLALASWTALVGASLVTPANAQDAGPSLPIQYTENRGQWPEVVGYRAQSGALTTWLVAGGWVVQAEERNGDHVRGVAVHMTFDSVPLPPRAESHTLQKGVRNYLLGDDRSRWATGVQSFARVRYADAFPGIDVVLREQAGVIEYDLVVAPGADLSDVMLRCAGQDRLSIAADGSLLIHTALGELRQTPPSTWATLDDGTRQQVKCRYTLLCADGFGFAVDGWPAGTELTIDPGFLWSSFLGGSGQETVSDMDVAANGDVVVAGSTVSTGFPTTPGAYQSKFAGSDCYVARFASGGKSLVFSTCLGGSLGDAVGGVHLAGDGTVWLSGRTGSNDFPTTPNRFQGYQLGSDAFVARLDAAGSNLVFSTYFGANTDDWAHDLHVDEAKQLVYICGTTFQKAGASGPLPLTTSAYQSTRPGWQGVFFTVFDFSTSSKPTLKYSTYFGKSWSYDNLSLHVDSTGIATIGGTLNTGQDMPVTANAYMPSAPSRHSLFISCFDPNQSGLQSFVYASYLGAVSANVHFPVRVHRDANGILTFMTLTGAADWPTTANAFQSTIGGSHDLALARIDTAKSGTAALVYSTFIGGGLREFGGALDVGADGIITLAMGAESKNMKTTSGAFQRSGLPVRPGYVLQLDTKPSTPTMTFASYLGSCGKLTITALHRDAQNIITLAGVGEGYLPIRTDAVQVKANVAGDVYVARMDTKPIPISAGKFGTACKGSTGTPTLEVWEQARACGRIRLRVTNVIPNRFGLLFIGVSNTKWGTVNLPLPLDPLGLPGCSLLVSPDVILRVPTTASSTLIWSFQVPHLISMVGKTAYFQYAFDDPTANQLGLAVTNGAWNRARW